MPGGNRAEAEQRTGDGDLAGFSEGEDLGLCAGFHDAVTGKNDRALR